MGAALPRVAATAPSGRPFLQPPRRRAARATDRGGRRAKTSGSPRTKTHRRPTRDGAARMSAGCTDQHSVPGGGSDGSIRHTCFHDGGKMRRHGCSVIERWGARDVIAGRVFGVTQTFTLPIRGLLRGLARTPIQGSRRPVPSGEPTVAVRQDLPRAGTSRRVCPSHCRVGAIEDRGARAAGTPGSGLPQLRVRGATARGRGETSAFRG